LVGISCRRILRGLESEDLAPDVGFNL